MHYEDIRKELTSFYWNNNNIELSKSFADSCEKILESKITEDMSVTEQVLLQQEIITENFEPVIFKTVPFFFETGTMTSLCDGSAYSKGANFIHAGGLVYKRNLDVFENTDKALFDKRFTHQRELLYLICGPFNDTVQHFNFNNRPILEGGLSSLSKKAEELLPTATEKEKEFLNSVIISMEQLKRCAEKFSKKAETLLKTEENPEYIKNLELIIKTAKRVPYEKPETFYEALCTLAFMRKLLGALEGIGPNTFGRVDIDLYPFYKNDIQKGILTKHEAYDLICKFLLVWDLHYDHDMKMIKYADHELENTYTLGGCDLDGNPLYNELTEMFLKANAEQKIIFPKIKCRFSKNSPKEYLDLIDESVIKGTSTILFQNDDATIPAIVRSGRPLSEARDYMVSGCWGMASQGTEKFDHGSYLNLLKPFEFAIHKLTDKMQKVGIEFKTYDDAKSFEEFYEITIENCKRLFEERMYITRKGGHIWHKVTVLPIFSSTLVGGIERKADFTEIGAMYNDDYMLCFGLPNIVDSLLAIKTLVFDQKKYTLDQYLTAVRNNWENSEDMRREAIGCKGFGDGEEESSLLANRFNNDIFTIAQNIKGTHGGKVHIGHLTYTEIRWWGEKTLATPDGRLAGDYFSQGLTPSRLKKLPSVTSVINSMKYLDATTMAANNVVNIILPSDKITLDICEGFLRTVADSAIMCLQLNCTTKEQLLDAQKHPENYPDLIVRVCGFSARFTSLTPEWQQEVLTRNFYK